MHTPLYLVEGDPPNIAIFYAGEPSTSPSSAVVSRCSLEYLDEGGANFVFTILPRDDTELSPLLQGKLLRLRKNLPLVPSAEDQLQALNSSFQGLFAPENLVLHELIALDQSVLVSLNESIRSMNRPSHRAFDFLPTEAMAGLLVTDMTPKEGDILVQLKPKWLAQSQNAPTNSRRCRTCAVRAQRASERIRTATDAQQSCPLDLVHTNVEDRKRAVRAITIDRKLQDHLLDQAQPLFQQLRACQLMFDQHGILKTSGPDAIQSLCKAMTLRDCTLFLKRSGNTVEARLGDLDLKPPEKLGRWKKVESALVSEGWYTNDESKEHWVKESICMLSRS